MDNEALNFTSDEDTTDANDLLPSFEVCPEDIKLIVR